MDKITLTLHGSAARQVVRSIATSYALLAIRSALPSDCVNAPWATGWRAKGGKTWSQAYREWMAGVDRERADYRKTLLTILPELPPAPTVDWKPYTSPDGKQYAAIYHGTRAVEAAKVFADAVVAMAVA